MKAKAKRIGHYLWREWIRHLAVAAAIVLPFKSAIADWNWVPSGSMKPTILEGDLVLVNKLAYDLKFPFTLFRLASWSHPERGDIVVFFSPHDGTRLVKRVVAIAGDTVELRENVLYLNGAALEYNTVNPHPFATEVYEDPLAIVAQEQSVDGSHWVMALPSRRAARNFAPTLVPEGKCFVMGDSRDNSFDSRFFGLVDQRQIVGSTRSVLLSFNKNDRYIPRVRRFFSSLDPVASPR